MNPTALYSQPLASPANLSSSSPSSSTLAGGSGGVIVPNPSASPASAAAETAMSVIRQQQQQRLNNYLPTYLFSPSSSPFVIDPLASVGSPLSPFSSFSPLSPFAPSPLNISNLVQFQTRDNEFSKLSLSPNSELFSDQVLNLSTSSQSAFEDKFNSAKVNNNLNSFDRDKSTRDASLPLNMVIASKLNQQSQPERKLPSQNGHNSSSPERASPVLSATPSRVQFASSITPTRPTKVSHHHQTEMICRICSDSALGMLF